MYPRIRALREDRDLKQSAVAALLHISQATYSRYESGALDIPTGVLIALAAFYGVSTDYLLGLTARSHIRPNRKKSAAQRSFYLLSMRSLIAVQLIGIGIHTPQKHFPVPEFHKLRPGLLVKGNHTAPGIHPHFPNRLSGHRMFHHAAPFSCFRPVYL